MTQLARKLRLTDYFTLGWGTMVGVGWLVVMDDWLLRGGPLGGILGFLIGGACCCPSDSSTANWSQPCGCGRRGRLHCESVSAVDQLCDWLDDDPCYFIVCPWEAVAVGRIAAYILPGLNSMELYRIAGKPVFLPPAHHRARLTGLLTLLNYRGIRLSASFQNWTAFGTLGLFVIFVALGASHGAPANFRPLFTHPPFLSVLLVMQIVPYYMTGFESVTKAAEEANPEFRSSSFFKAIAMAILVGAFFYAIVIAAVGYVAPWKQFMGHEFMTAAVFERAIGSHWIVSVILAAALLSLLKCFNGNFVAASRLLFAMGRRGLIDERVAECMR